MALPLAACGTQKRETLELFAMDTYMTFVAIGDGADDVLTDLSRTVNTLESSLSRTVDTSEVSRLNRDGSAVWDEDGAQLLSWALQHSQETDGAFDITIAPAGGAVGHHLRQSPRPLSGGDRRAAASGGL